jgi:hypothetical protein
MRFSGSPTDSTKIKGKSSGKYSETRCKEHEHLFSYQIDKPTVVENSIIQATR